MDAIATIMLGFELTGFKLTDDELYELHRKISRDIEHAYRHRYQEEQRCADWIDLGGEA